MTACKEYEELVTLHAAEALEAPEAARVRTHLESCAGCRADEAATREVLGLVAQPPVTAREEAALEALPRRAMGAWRREQVRKASRLRLAGALLAAAAVALLVVAPRLVQRTTQGQEPPTRVEEVAATETQEEPAEQTLPLEEFSTMELWAMTDPLGEAQQASSDTTDFEDSDGALDLGTEDFPEMPYSGDWL